MNSDEAKFILQARRPNGTDDGTPAMRDALDQAARDPLVSDWLAKQQRFDGAVTQALRQVQPPADLRALILAGAALQTAPRARAWWRRPSWLALAASLALIATVATLSLVRPRPTDAPPSADYTASANIAALRDLALAESVGPHTSAVHADEIGELGRWLEAPGQRLTVGLPLDFDALKALGCRSLTVAGREVLEVCFVRDQVYHLYIARRSDFTPGPDGSTEIARHNGLVVASWARDDLVHVLATKGDETALLALL